MRRYRNEAPALARYHWIMPRFLNRRPTRGEKSTAAAFSFFFFIDDTDKRRSF
jgi:hypothetical protein